MLVQADRRWTDTGIDVRLTDRISFRPRDRFGSAARGPTCQIRGRVVWPTHHHGACAASPAGVLIARIGESDAFDVGTRTSPVRAPRDGRLFLGINDDHIADNQGAFRVEVTVERSPR